MSVTAYFVQFHLTYLRSGTSAVIIQRWGFLWHSSAHRLIFRIIKPGRPHSNRTSKYEVSICLMRWCHYSHVKQVWLPPPHQSFYISPVINPPHLIIKATYLNQQSIIPSRPHISFNWWSYRAGTRISVHFIPRLQLIYHISQVYLINK